MTTTVPTLDDFIKYNRGNEYGIFEPEEKLISFHSYADLISFINDWQHLLNEGWTLEYMWDARDVELLYVWTRDAAGVEQGTKVTITRYCSDYRNKSRTYHNLTKATVSRLIEHFDMTARDRRSSTPLTGNSALFIFKV